MIKQFKLFFYILGLSVFLTGCQSTDDEIMKDRPAEELYKIAETELEDKNYQKAAKFFDEVDRQHPYSKWAGKSQIMAAYSHYLHQKYAQAIAQLETFIQLHPGHKDVDYAYYMLGLCYYEQINYVRRDQLIAKFALEAFQEVVRRFSNSKYGKDAKYKIDLVKDHLAGKDMSIGRYYLKRGGYGSALIRFRNVVQSYPTTPHVQEAMHRLVETYLLLGLKEDAQAVASVLGHNYPESIWYKESYYLLTKEDLRPDYSKVTASWLNNLLGKRLEG